jgi:hypothetical protein
MLTAAWIVGGFVAYVVVSLALGCLVGGAAALSATTEEEDAAIIAQLQQRKVSSV